MRLQLVNWIIYYREKLHGKTFEQLQAEREAERLKPLSEEIANLPSEIMYNKLRVDEVETSSSEQQE